LTAFSSATERFKMSGKPVSARLCSFRAVSDGIGRALKAGCLNMFVFKSSPAELIGG
jgi:hypothetical protein